MFTPDTISNFSFKMGEAKISRDYAIDKFGSKLSKCNYCEFTWEGSFIAKDGSKHRVSFWDWHDGLKLGYGVSVWISNKMYLPEFIKYIET
jgi:hypothetical protein